MQLSIARDFVVVQDRPIALSVVVPTFNEVDNVARLFERLAIALADIEWEAIFVDDASSDGTPELLTRMATDDRRIRLIRRFNRRGLSSAVLEGMLASTAPVLAVIDADLQHDERILPDLFRSVQQGQDLAVGTRYSSGGSIGDWSAGRAFISRAATRVAGLVVKTPLSDPMSGFFAISREALLAAVPRTTGIGYKVLLDIVASAPERLKAAEIPYTFSRRQAGESKLDSLVALEYAELLLEKLVGRWIPVRFILFALVGALGLLVHLATLGATLAVGGAFVVAQAAAVFSAMTFNFLLNNRLTYRDRRLTGARMLWGLISFYLVCGIGAVANVGVGEMLYSGRGEAWWLAGAAGAAVGSVWNYVIGSVVTWRRRPG